MKPLYETTMINTGGRNGNAHKAHNYCPYSKAINGNVEVEITVK